MPEMRMLPFLNTFANCQFPPEVRRELADCTVAVGIDRVSRVMKLRLDGPAPLSETALDCVRAELARVFQLAGVEIDCTSHTAETTPEPEKAAMPDAPGPAPGRETQAAAPAPSWKA